MSAVSPRQSWRRQLSAPRLTHRGRSLSGLVASPSDSNLSSGRPFQDSLSWSSARSFTTKSSSSPTLASTNGPKLLLKPEKVKRRETLITWLLPPVPLTAAKGTRDCCRRQEMNTTTKWAMMTLNSMKSQAPILTCLHQTPISELLDGKQVNKSSL